jgi:WD40 repeat protein/Flp pilus assembly protein TadD
LDRIQVWSVETGEVRTLVNLPAGQTASSGTALAFSPDGGLLAGSTSNETVTFWDAQTGEKRLQFKVRGGVNGRVGRLAFSTDGERLATAGNDGLVQVFDTRTRQEVYSFPHGSAGWHRLAFSADNAALAAANTTMYGAAPQTVLLSAATVPSRTYLEGASRVALFSPDGRLAAAAGPENDILLFDAFTGKRLRRLEGHKEQISYLVFSDDGKRLASDSLGSRGGNHNFGEILVWNVETGKQLASFGDFDDNRLLRVVLSADGSRVAASLFVSTKGAVAEWNIEIYVFDVATGKRLRAIPAEDASLAFAEDGKVVASRNRAGKVLGWSVETGDKVTVAGDPFAKAEREERTEDGRRLGSFGGTYFIQAAPDERQRQRLEAQSEPDPFWHADAARTAEANKQWFAAGFHLGRLLLKSPGDVELLCRRARAFTAQKRWKEADADCDEALRLQPQSAEAWATRGLLEYRQGRLEPAHADLARAAGAAPDDPAVAAVQVFLFVVDKQTEKAGAAEKLMLERLETLQPLSRRQKFSWPYPLRYTPPEIPPVWPVSAWPVLEEALTDRLADDAKAVPLLRLRGVMRAAQGKWHEALPDFREAVAVDANDGLAWKGIACALYRGMSELPKELPHACDEVVRLDSGAWDFWCVRGNYDFQDGHKPAAIEAYTKALALRPDFDLGYRIRGWLHADLGQWDKAITDFTRAAELSGRTDPAPWDALALAQLARDDTAAYHKTCTRMLALFDRPPPLIWAGGAFAAGPFNTVAAPVALHVAEQAASLSRDAVGVTAVRFTTRPDARTDWQRLVSLTEKSPDELRGAVFCRVGRYDEAVKLLEPLHTALGNPAPLNTLYIALAEHGRGRTAEARQLLKETTDWLEQPQIDWLGLLQQGNPRQKNRDGLGWAERVQIDQLCRELEGLLKDKVP